MHFSELAILRWQIAASGLMGVDYFVPKISRDRINGSLTKYFRNVQGNVDADIESSISYLWSVKWPLLVSVIGSFSPWMVHFLFTEINSRLHSMLFLSTNLIALVFFSISVVGVVQLLAPTIVPFFAGLPLRGVSAFLARTERGTLSGIGFICLIISFAMRYANQP